MENQWLVPALKQWCMLHSATSHFPHRVPCNSINPEIITFLPGKMFKSGLTYRISVFWPIEVRLHVFPYSCGMGIIKAFESVELQAGNLTK